MGIPYKNILKIIVITLIFVAGYKAFLYASNWELVAEKIKENNATRFQSASAQQFLSISAAISTRIGIGYSQNGGNGLSESFYKQITNIWATPQEKTQIRENLITQNMLIIGEYLNLSRSDIKSLLASSSDREKTLDWYISQLELRQNNSLLSLESLEKHKAELLVYISELESAIETVKSDMENNFSNGNSTGTLENVETYFNLREQYTISFTDIVFINQFIKQHSFLTQYNVGILSTLKTNRQAIIDQTYVVVPSTGSEYLRPLELIFNEAEIDN